MVTAYLLMTSAYDRNDVLVTAQEKLEWVTPKISLMGAGKTEGFKLVQSPSEITNGTSSETQRHPS